MGPPESSSWSRLDALLVLFILTAATVLSRLPFTPPEPLGMESPDSAFSAARAAEHLQIIARGPHLPGSPEHERVREYLLANLRLLGFETEYQNTTWIRRLGGTRACAVWNVVGRLPGSDPSGGVLLMAHYDPVPHSSGSNDDGTSVAAILEAVRALRSGPPLKNDLFVLFTDGEELGSMGSRAFVDGHRWLRDVSVVVNLEIRSRGGASWMFETGEQSGWVVRAFADADPRPVANSMALEVYRTMTAFTDLTPFLDVGIQGLNFTTLAGASTYHLALDDLDHTSPASMQHQGFHALSLTRYLGNVDLTQTRAPDRVYVTVPVFGFLSYSPALDWIGLLLAAALAGISLLLGWRGGRMGWKGLLAGTGVVLLSLTILGPATAEGFDWLRGVHPEWRLIQGSAFHQEGWYLLAVLALTGAVVLGSVGFFRRWFGLLEMAWGGALFVLLGATAVAVFYPLGALNLVWPVLFAELGLLLAVSWPEGSREDQRRRAGLLLGLGLVFLPVLILLVPVTEMVWMAVGISMAPIFAVAGTTALVLLLPILAPFQDRYRWRAPIALALGFAVFTGVGLAASEPDPDHPLPASLFYVMDRDEGRAWWATGDGSDNAWIRERVPSTEVRRGERGESFYPSRVFTAPADPVEAEAPVVEILADTVRGDRRLIRLSIHSRIRAEVIHLAPGQGVEASLLAVNDRAVDGDNSGGDLGDWPLTHWGDPGKEIEVQLSVSSEEGPVEFLLREVLYRPDELLGPEAFNRPPFLIPAPVGTSDVAILGTRILLPPAGSA